jgi:hypothetical protein
MEAGILIKNKRAQFRERCVVLQGQRWMKKVKTLESHFAESKITTWR